MELNKKEDKKQFEIRTNTRTRNSLRFNDDAIIQENKDYKKVNMTNILKKIANSKSSKKKEK